MCCGGRWWLRHVRLGIGQSAPRACAQHQGLWAQQMVDVEGAGGALRLLSQSHTIEVVIGWWRASVGDRAIGIVRLCTTPGPFNPVDREGDGVRLVALDHRRCRSILWLWPLVGRSPVIPRDQHRMLLRNTGAFPGHRGSVDRGTCPVNTVGGSAPSHRCVGVERG